MGVEDTLAIYAQANENGRKLKTALYTGWRTYDVIQQQRTCNSKKVLAGKALK